MADKFEGSIHNPPMSGLTLAVKEPIGIVASIMNVASATLLSITTIISSLICKWQCEYCSAIRKNIINCNIIISSF